jgi:hemoglobin
MPRHRPTCRRPPVGAIVYLMLYEEVGGAAVLRTAVAVLYQRVLADPALAPWFVGVDMDRLRAHQHAFLTSALGGPNVFAGRTIADAHQGLHISGAAFDRLTDHLTAVLRDLGVAPDAVAEVSGRLEALRPLVVDEREQPAGSGARDERERTR